VLLDETGSIKTAIVVVPDRQLSLAIGKEGQNARLAAKLTGWRIDIKSESEAMKEGLDRLAVEQAQKTRSADLFSVVERFLQDEEKPPVANVGEDLLSKAARALENMEPRSERSESLELPSLEMPELTSERRDFRDLWPIEGFQEPEEPIGEALNPEEEEEVQEPVSSRALELPDSVEEVNKEEGLLASIPFPKSSQPICCGRARTRASICRKTS
jgi:hypothetical protein